MARGWESKAVEAQIEQAGQAGQAVQTAREPVEAAPMSLEQKHKLDGLRLIRSQTNEQLQRARTVTQRQMLHEQLRAIDAEIAALDSAP